MNERLTRGEVAIIGLARSGVAAARLARREGAQVYASDASADADAGDLETMGVSVQRGGHDLQRIARAGLVVVSPGVPPGAAPVAAARKAKVPVVSEVELALWSLGRARTIAVTGTNGKSTVTALIAHILKSCGAEAIAAGNIGLALSEVALMPNPPAWIALEMSSFQLHDTLSLRPQCGVLTNLAPDHTDRYETVEEYYADKDRLFANANATSAWVTNADDVEVLRRTKRVPGAHRHFSVAGLQVDAQFDKAHDTLMLFGSPLLARGDLPLKGDHNVANALAAALAVASADRAFGTAPARERIAAGLRTFAGLPHRLETVAEGNGVLWINDSKATNVASARVAIEGMTRPAVVLLGGKHKNESYASLAAPLTAHARHVIAYGQSAPLIVADLGGRLGDVPLERLESSFEEVVRRAGEVARPGDAVLLAPACSSFDMFRNYEDRGDTFRRLARAAADGSGA